MRKKYNVMVQLDDGVSSSPQMVEFEAGTKKEAQKMLKHFQQNDDYMGGKIVSRRKLREMA